MATTSARNLDGALTACSMAAQAKHAPYNGFLEGDRINDHDIALGYVLTHYEKALPPGHSQVTSRK